MWPMVERRRSSRLMLPTRRVLARDEDTARVLGVVAAIAFVHVGALNRAAGELFGGGNQRGHRTDCRAARWRARTNTTPGARALLVVIEALTPNS
jgi:hypothetical protein